MHSLLEILKNGLTLGLLYALIAIGYTLVYGILELINFAHGEVMMFGAFYALALSAGVDTGTALGTAILAGATVGVAVFDRLEGRSGRWPARGAGVGAGILSACVVRAAAGMPLPLPAAILLALPLSAAMGISLERICYRPLRGAGRLAPLISAIGASLCLQNLAQLDPDSFRLPGLGSFGFFGTIRLSYATRPENLDPLIWATAIGCMLALTFFIRRTRMGTAMRAVAQNPRVASLLGVDTNGVIALTFAIGSILAAVAGILYGMYLGSLSPYMGYMAGIKAFSAAVLGGIGNIPGAMLGGILIGLLESLSAAYIHPGYKDAVAFVVLIGVLLVRPSGLLGSRVPEKV